jgi:AbrB family looped-hinge helix DNA binding protein
MKVVIDSAGRLVIPKLIRRQISLKPGDALEIRCRDGRIELEPVPLTLRLRHKGPLVVATPSEPVEPLTTQTVESTRSALRRERSGRAAE